MALSLPQIEIKFKQLANTFIARSARGIAILIIRDKTDFNHKQYDSIEDLKADKKLYNAENYQYLNDVMEFGCATMGVVVIQKPAETKGVGGTMEDALKIIGQKYNTGWIGMVGEHDDYEAIAEWVKTKASTNNTFKTIVAGVDGSDHECIHELDGVSVTFADDRGKQDIKYYIPSMIGIASACNITRGLTYYECKNLVEVEEVANITTALTKGKLILVNDYGTVRIGLGINSLITFDGVEKFEDMRYIDIIEAMHMMKDDIREVYKTKYVGACKNKLDNQMIFISAVNTYLEELEELEVLDNLYENYVDVNVNAQRKAWETVNSEAKTWDDTKVKNMAFKREVFLLGDVKILGAMENLALEIYAN